MDKGSVGIFAQAPRSSTPFSCRILHTLLLGFYPAWHTSDNIWAFIANEVCPAGFTTEEVGCCAFGGGNCSRESYGPSLCVCISCPLEYALTDKTTFLHCN